MNYIGASFPMFLNMLTLLSILVQLFVISAYKSVTNISIPMQCVKLCTLSQMPCLSMEILSIKIDEEKKKSCGHS